VNSCGSFLYEGDGRFFRSLARWKGNVKAYQRGRSPERCARYLISKSPIRSKLEHSGKM
jgi:hypothetical protein